MKSAKLQTVSWVGPSAEWQQSSASNQTIKRNHKAGEWVYER